MTSSSNSIKKLLIANRGEIACRVIKTAQASGIPCVAIFSDADKSALHVKMADEAVYIGPAPAKESYLVIDKIINAAKITGANAIHPGYGFLSENASFAEQCKKNNIIFVGPPVEAIKSMGSKSAAKTIMEAAKVPLVPGYHGASQDAKLLLSESNKIGYPVLLKATAGGGGKGMRIVWKESEFDDALAAAKRESLASFNDDTMLVEKYLTKPRHVEIQVFCDSLGTGVYLFERDCSIQRRHQKVIEEAPAPAFSEDLRKKMGAAALKAAHAIGYEGAGTVEFLLDHDGSFYFMEMNTRLQVEHPVTEMITGQDLVHWQLLVAVGQPLPCTQEALQINGHAIEVRIYAEDPDNDFLPATGVIDYLKTPKQNQHVRIDTGISKGDEVSVYYDPMISKLIVWDTNRNKAIIRMKQALIDYHIAGLKTNIPFLKRLMDQPEFSAEKITTNFIEIHQTSLFPSSSDSNLHNSNLQKYAILIAIRHYLDLQDKKHLATSNDKYSPWNATDCWRLNQPSQHSCILALDDKEFEVNLKLESDRIIGLCGNQKINVQAELVDSHFWITEFQSDNPIRKHQYNIHRSTNKRFTIFVDGEAHSYTIVDPDHGSVDPTDTHDNLKAPMNGTIISILVNQGDNVKKGDSLLIVEAMKMEHTIKAPADGLVKEIYYHDGDLVSADVELLEFIPSEANDNQDLPQG